MREGLSALLHGNLSVAVLDATAIAVSLLRRDFSTAGSVMFMLRLGEILEEWTHKKSVADLAGAMALHVEQVWLRANGTEVLTPIEQRSGGRRDRRAHRQPDPAGRQGGFRRSHGQPVFHDRRVPARGQAARQLCLRRHRGRRGRVRDLRGEGHGRRPV